MNARDNSTILKTETPAQILARSAFGFALVAFVPIFIVWVAFLLSPIPDAVDFAQIRSLIITLFSWFMLISLGLCIALFRATAQTLLPIANWIANILDRRVIALTLCLSVLEINFVVFLVSPHIAPNIVGPLKFLMVWWSALLFGILFIIHRDRLAQWLKRTERSWAILGLLLFGFALLSGLYFSTHYFIQTSGLEARLRGNLDNRPLIFYNDGQPVPTPQQFWSEQAQTRVQWLPYLYWTVEPFKGAYINVEANGLRHTPSYVSEGTNAKRIYFFGGSTMWGEGARDAYTIAGHTARLLAEMNEPQWVENYGQTGYVSTQEMLLFQFQLANNNIPDLAIFYDGFNDLYSAYLQDISGIPYRESNRISDAEAGRLLRAGQPVFRLPDGDITAFDWSLVGQKGVSAEAVIDRWLANIRMIEAIADAYGIQTLFIWQPAIIFKKGLTGNEPAIYKQIEEKYPGFISLYQAADNYLRQRIAQEGFDNILIFSDLFAEDPRPIFHDLVHITEEANLTVAQALLPYISEAFLGE